MTNRQIAEMFCHGRKRFDGYASAANAALNAGHSRNLVPFYCAVCHAWHYGHYREVLR